jgi:hypothetical protein
MKRKSKKTFRGAPAEHRKAANIDLSDSRRAQKDFNRQLRQSDCSSALSSLIRASKAQASFSTEIFYSDRRKSKPLRKALQKMQDRFLLKCLR